MRAAPPFEVIAFEGWTGGLTVVSDGSTVYVGAGEGGAPRLATFSAVTGVRLTDRFVGDPESRAGVPLVAVPVPTGEPEPRPNLASGDASSFTIYVDDERGVSAAESADTFDALPPLFPGLPLYFTTERPDAEPASYKTVILGSPLTYAGSGIIGRAYPPSVAYVVAGLTPAYTATVAAHEIGHLFGLSHSTTPLDLMNTPVDLGSTFAASELVWIGEKLTGGPGS